MTLMLVVVWFPGLYLPPHLAPSYPSLITFPLPEDSEEQRLRCVFTQGPCLGRPIISGSPSEGHSRLK